MVIVDKHLERCESILINSGSDSQHKMEILPESRVCDYCLSNGEYNDMELRFINPKQAIYICDTCDEVYPQEGNPIDGDVNNQPLKESDIKQIGLPEAVLLHFPTLKLDFANKIIRVINYRWRKKLTDIWEDFMVLNDRINIEKGLSRKMEYNRKNGLQSSEKNDDSVLFDISSIDDEDLKRITCALDEIEIKATANLKTHNNKKNGEICPVNTDEFFNRYKATLRQSTTKKNRQNGKKVYTNIRKDIKAEHVNLRRLQQKMLLKKMSLKMPLLSSKCPQMYNDVLLRAQHNSANLHPERITKDILSKMLESLKA